MTSFSAFFFSKKSDCTSPFLTEAGRKCANHLELKKAFFSLFLLNCSLFFSFYSSEISLLFLSLVYFLHGTRCFLTAWKDIRKLDLNIDTLMALAAFICLLIGSGLEGGLLLVLFALSAAMEKAFATKANSALHDLQTLAAQKAWVINDEEKLYEKSVKDICLGEKILVKVGEYVPLDGKILQGSSCFDLSHLTGESLPVEKTCNDIIPAGAKNHRQSVILSVVKTAKDSTLHQIISLMQKASLDKPKIKTYIERFGKKYSLFVIATVASLAIGLPFITNMHYTGSEGSIYRALTLLITASPCALIIGAPSAYIAALSTCAKRGILVKSGSVFDALTSCKTICFDKTGTLTCGDIVVQSCRQIAGPFFEEKQALCALKTLERQVTHPIAKAVENFTSNLPVLPLKNFSETPGQGLQGLITIENQTYQVSTGNALFLKKYWKDSFPNFTTQPANSFFFLLLEKALFIVEFTNPVRDGAEELIQKLQAKSLTTCMLTGDEKKNASFVANTLGIKAVFSNLEPEGKLDFVEKLAQDNGLIMVGDGINDAPSLARATVGISLGNIGSFLALQAADIILLKDQIEEINDVLDHSYKTLLVVQQNIFLALTTIIFASIFAFLGMMPLWLSVLLHEGGTVLVSCNSLRLCRKSQKRFYEQLSRYLKPSFSFR